jgi:hypothetical protein
MRARFAELPLEELRRVVTNQRDDYEPEAIAIAEAELAQRGSAGTHRESPAAPGTAPPAPRGKAPHPVLYVWFACIAGCAGAYLLGAVLRGSGFEIVLRLVIAGAVVPMLLAARRRWKRDAR